MVYIGLGIVATTLPRLFGRPLRDRLQVFAMQEELELFCNEVTSQGFEVEHFGGPRSRQVNQVIWIGQLVRRSPVVVLVLVQVVLRPSPWLTAIPIAVFLMLEVILRPVGDFAPFRRALSDDERHDWQMLGPALIVQSIGTTIALVLGWNGIISWSNGQQSIPIMSASIGLLAVVHLPARFVSSRRRAASPSTFAEQSSTNAVLFLRSFVDDETRIFSRTNLVPYAGAPLLHVRAPRFEEVVEMAVANTGSLVAIGRPGQRLPQLGAHRTYWPDSAWHEAVTITALRSQMIIMIAGVTEGLKWEFNQLRSLGLLRKSIILVPPGDNDSTFQRFSNILDLLELPYSGFSEYRPGFLLGVGFDGLDQPIFYTGNGRGWLGYFWAISKCENRILFGGKGESEPTTILPKRAATPGVGTGTGKAVKQLHIGLELATKGDLGGANAVLEEGLSLPNTGRNLELFLRLALVAVAEEADDAAAQLRTNRAVAEQCRRDLGGSRSRTIIYSYRGEMIPAVDALVDALVNAARAAEQLGATQEVLSILSELLVETERVNPTVHSWTHLMKSATLLSVGDVDAALSASLQGIRNGSERGDVLGVARLQIASARAYEQLENREATWEALQSALGTFQRAYSRDEEADLQLLIGQYLLVLGDVAGAVERLEAGVRLCALAGSKDAVRSAIHNLERAQRDAHAQGLADAQRAAEETLVTAERLLEA